MKTQSILHILRNPSGWTEKEQDKARLAAADEIEKWKIAYENLLEFANSQGLDTSAYN